MREPKFHTVALIVGAALIAKKSSEIECISMEQEVQQGMIDKSVVVNPEECYSEAYLPFLCDPTKKLVDNYDVAEKFYRSQVKKLSFGIDRTTAVTHQFQSC